AGRVLPQWARAAPDPRRAQDPDPVEALREAHRTARRPQDRVAGPVRRALRAELRPAPHPSPPEGPDRARPRVPAVPGDGAARDTAVARHDGAGAAEGDPDHR